MTLLTMTVPDDPSELPRWLEQRLMAPDFGRFVAELSAHFSAAPGAAQPLHLLDRWLPVALEEGLDPIPAEVLMQLLRHPAVLTALQERIVTDGGAYWDDVPDTSDDLSERVERGKLSLEPLLSADASPSAVPSGVKRTSGRGYKVLALVSTGTAACLAAVIVWQTVSGPSDPSLPKAQIAWGWGKPGGAAADESNPRDYLNRLAASAEEWSLHQPSDPTGVGTRLAELRLGCTRLMHSTYGPLTPADRTWLLERCRAWAKVLDEHQQALDAGADALAVRAAVDETVREIATTLREKARQVG